MTKIFNESFKGKSLSCAFGKLSFNNEGIAEVNDEAAKLLLELTGFTSVGNKEHAVKGVATEPTAEVEKPAEDYSKMNIMQLKKIAKDQGIDLGTASKKDEILAILNA